MPIVLGIAGVLGVLVIASHVMGGGGAIVTRNPPPPPAPPGPPAAPGVDHGLAAATRDTEALADVVRAEPRRSTATLSSEPARGPVASSTHLEIDPPRRPSPPPRRRGVPSSSIPSASATERARRESRDPDNVVALANAIANTSMEPIARARAVMAFQRAYGQGLAVDGDYGANTRHAVSLILGVAESSLPSIR